MATILNNDNLDEFGAVESNTRIAIIAISLPSQQFLDCHLRFHIFFRNFLFGGHTLKAGMF